MSAGVKASLPSRLGAFLLDVLLFLLTLPLMDFILGYIAGLLGLSIVKGLGWVTISIISVVLYFPFFLWFLARGQTPGKSLMDIRAVDKRNGSEPGIGRMLFRETLGKWVSGCFLGLGWFWAIWDRDAQAWHDKISGTVVLHRRTPSHEFRYLYFVSGALILSMGIVWAIFTNIHAPNTKPVVNSAVKEEPTASAMSLQLNRNSNPVAEDTKPEPSEQAAPSALDSAIKVAERDEPGVQDNRLNDQGVPHANADAGGSWRTAAEHGDAVAQYNLGILYERGQGVPRDYVQSVYWYRKAAEQNYPPAQNDLGASYYDGRGVAQDYLLAVYWDREAAEQGYAKAQENLGIAYFRGQGVPQDYAQAYFWFDIAASGGIKGVENLETFPNMQGVAASHLKSEELSEVKERIGKWMEDHSSKVP